ncbi:MAG: hypothetical protein HKUEN01_14190 [Candidatus Kuenenia stuttgartiensis]|nr:MAG: hypothetical protein HKUEN01_14190 [Candidatus Kuenenia stuttgartiensis]
MTNILVTKCPRNNTPLIDHIKKPTATKKIALTPKVPSDNKSFDIPINQLVTTFRFTSIKKE